MRFTRGNVRGTILFHPKSITDLRSGVEKRRSCGEVQRSTFARFSGSLDFRLLQQYRPAADVGSGGIRPNGTSRSGTVSVLLCAAGVEVNCEMHLEDLYRLLRSEHVQAQGIVDTLEEPLLVLDQAGCVITGNRGFFETFKVGRDDTVGRSLFALGDGQWVFLNSGVSWARSFPSRLLLLATK